MNFRLARLFLLPAAPVAVLLSGCISLDKLPKMSMPELPKVKVPFVGNDATAPANDPQIPWSLKQPLAHGHTLDLAVYAGQRSPAKIFAGAVMVDEHGKVDLGKFGTFRVAGKTASQAVREMEAAFRRKRGESLITVQLISIEGTPLLTVHGAVKHEGVIQYFGGANPANILQYVGGRDERAAGRAVYVTRRGVRAFHSDSMNPDISLEEGDVVTFSDAL
jgi:protein involved in polysaccharide export with SLBB domain